MSNVADALLYSVQAISQRDVPESHSKVASHRQVLSVPSTIVTAKGTVSQKSVHWLSESVLTDREY